MSENLEVAKKIIRAYWSEIVRDAEYGYSSMSYDDAVTMYIHIDNDIEIHIKTVAKIMNKALKELQKDKNDNNNKGQDQTNTNQQADERTNECVGSGDS